MSKTNIPFHCLLMCDTLVGVLRRVNSPISRHLLNFEYYDGTLRDREGWLFNFLSVKPNGNITYLDKNRYLVQYKNFSSSVRFDLDNGYCYRDTFRHMVSDGIGRYEVKPGRLINKLLPNRYSPTELESFVDELKRILALSQPKSVEIVEGEELLKAYHKNNYSIVGHGTLHSSCMSGNREQKYLGIYVQNPESIKLIVARDKDDRIGARSLAWYKKGVLVHYDRIYYVNTSYKHMLINWMEEYYPNVTSIHDASYNFTCPIEHTEFQYYPYLDSLRYLDKEKGTLSNVFARYKMRSTDGGLYDDYIDEYV